MKLTIQHRTTYRYSDAPAYGLQQIRLTPLTRPGQNVLSWQIGLSGATRQADFRDQFGNHTVLARLDPDASELSVSVQGMVETQDMSGVSGREAGFVPLWLYRRSTPLTEAGPGIQALAGSLRNPARSVLDGLHDLSARISDAVGYQTGQTDTLTTAADALSAGHGVCQDHSHIFIAAARQAGIPARYVSGYLMMNDRIDQDATHAWAEAFVPDLGWTGFDVSNGISPDTRYVHVATGLDYKDAAPTSGVLFGGREDAVSVDIQVQQ